MRLNVPLFIIIFYYSYRDRCYPIPLTPMDWLTLKALFEISNQTLQKRLESIFSDIG